MKNFTLALCSALVMSLLLFNPQFTNAMEKEEQEDKENGLKPVVSTMLMRSLEKGKTPLRTIDNGTVCSVIRAGNLKMEQTTNLQGNLELSKADATAQVGASFSHDNLRDPRQSMVSNQIETTLQSKTIDDLSDQQLLDFINDALILDTIAVIESQTPPPSSNVSTTVPLLPQDLIKKEDESSSEPVSSVVYPPDPASLSFFEAYQKASTERELQAFEYDLMRAPPEVQFNVGVHLYRHPDESRLINRRNQTEARKWFGNVTKSPNASQQLITHAYDNLAYLCVQTDELFLAHAYMLFAEKRNDANALYWGGINLFRVGGKNEAWWVLLQAEKLGHIKAGQYLDYIVRNTGDDFLVHQKLRDKGMYGRASEYEAAIKLNFVVNSAQQCDRVQSNTNPLGSCDKAPTNELELLTKTAQP
jgi:hypothetical protein